jgi:hypothetical protein
MLQLAAHTDKTTAAARAAQHAEERKYLFQKRLPGYLKMITENDGGHQYDMDMQADFNATMQEGHEAQARLQAVCVQSIQAAACARSC